MIEKFELLIHFIVTLIKLSTPGGVKVVMAETQTMKQQLIVMNRGKRRAPKLTSFDRFFFGLMAFIMGEKRWHKVSVILKSATILKFHKALVQRKYRGLFSNKARGKPGRRPRDKALIELVIEMRQRNPGVEYGRIAMQIYEAFGIEISRFAVGRILRQNWGRMPPGEGPSWLTFTGHMKDSLCSRSAVPCRPVSL